MTEHFQKRRELEPRLAPLYSPSGGALRIAILHSNVRQKRLIGPLLGAILPYFQSKTSSFFAIFGYPVLCFQELSGFGRHKKTIFYNFHLALHLRIPVQRPPKQPIDTATGDHSYRLPWFGGVVEKNAQATNMNAFLENVYDLRLRLDFRGGGENKVPPSLR